MANHDSGARKPDPSTDTTIMSTVEQVEQIGPFFKLPGELRNQIYEILLTNNRDPNDRIINGERVQIRINSRRTFPDNNVSAPKPISPTTPLFHSAILRTCRHAHDEGISILYGKNVFATIISVTSEEPRLPLFPGGVEISKIQHLQLEYRPRFNFNFNRRIGNSHTRCNKLLQLTHMHDLRDITIAVTFSHHEGAKSFNQHWHDTAGFNYAMRDLISAIPKHVKDVNWGLNKEQKSARYSTHHYFPENCVLRKIWRIYRHLQGMDVGLKPMMGYRWGDGTIDGDGDDSDEE
ncbi:hypothetical protein K491DRAFT_713980 [Lophiostoma macrostomum CBS 122681]|uniref:DUF7730 domain-containing protein n=1 Tax=Lophiostoma macrostomum CBS 122681 TaxID=1314788 RepID=A0A6A6TE92_9PLEO|nr:hypothetical protein K491DRAFT_713980 [Lophiostoma macrostomum CBS 122681]